MNTRIDLYLGISWRDIFFLLLSALCIVRQRESKEIDKKIKYIEYDG
jgi:hypothetical protein